MNNKMYEKTIDFYNKNADEFTNNTIDVEFDSTQNRFLKKLNSGAYILDFGCGSGRDTKYFLSKGFKVDAVDGSEEMCKIASEYTGIEVRNMYFDELDAVDRYDAIWACASVLHLTNDDLLEVLKKVSIALKSEGLLYLSFKYGENEEERNGRYFNDMTGKKFEEILKELEEFHVREQWISLDARPERRNEKWMNLILQK